MALRLSGRLDVVALEGALADVVSRHEVLRTVFPVVDGVAYQHIVPADQVGSVLVTVHTVPGDLDQAVGDAARHAFDLARDIPFHVALITTGGEPVAGVVQGECVLVVVVHHIAADGWSIRPLAADLSRAYAARWQGGPGFGPVRSNTPTTRCGSRVCYGDRRDPHSEIAAQTGTGPRIVGDPGTYQLPTDRPVPDGGLYRGCTTRSSSTRTCISVSRRPPRPVGRQRVHGPSRGLAVLLNKLGAGEDIVIATPTADVADDALDDLVGFLREYPCLAHRPDR